MDNDEGLKGARGVCGGGGETGFGRADPLEGSSGFRASLTYLNKGVCLLKHSHL